MGALPLLQPRDVTTQVDNFKSNFSSYDSCMAASVCKYPFIVLCVVVGLIVLSTLFCLIRCVMCGYACCACCCGGCGGGRRKTSEHHTTTYVLPPPAHHGPVIDRPPAPHYDEPKYAYFESSPDALPHMPSAHGVEVKRPVSVVEEHEMTPVTKGPAYDVARDGARSPGGSSIRTAAPPPVYQQPQPQPQPVYGDMQYGNTRALVPPTQQYPPPQQQQYPPPPQHYHGYEEEEQYYPNHQQQYQQPQHQQQRGYEMDMPAEPYQAYSPQQQQGYHHEQQGYHHEQQQQQQQQPAYRAYDDGRRQQEWSGV